MFLRAAGIFLGGSRVQRSDRKDGQRGFLRTASGGPLVLGGIRIPLVVGGCGLLRVAFGIQEHGGWGAFLRHSRQALAALGVVLLGALALSTAVRRPYLCKSSSPAHTAKASVMTEVHQDPAPLAQPVNIPMTSMFPPRSDHSLPIRAVVIPQPPGFFRLHALRSPPLV